MPIPVVKSFNFDVSHQHGVFIDCLAFQIQTKHLSHRAPPAVAANKEIRSNGFAGGECGLYAALILLECCQSFSEL